MNVSSRLEKRAKLTAETLGFVEDPAAELKKEGKGIRGSAYADSKRAMMLWIAHRAEPLAADHNTYVLLRGICYYVIQILRLSLLWGPCLTHRSRGRYVSATTPGMVDTQLGRNSMSSALWPLTKPLRWLLLRSPAEGALSAVAAGLVDGADKRPGLYMDGVKELEALPQSRAEQAGLGAAVYSWARDKCGL